MERSVICSEDGQALPTDPTTGLKVELSGTSSTSINNLLTDAFGRLRVSDPVTLFDSKLTKNAQPLNWDDVEFSGSGTGSTWAAARQRLSVTANTAGVRVRQTKRFFNYQAGKSQFVKMTFVLGAPTAGITRRAGQFDANNGIFLEQTADGYFFVVRNATSDTRIAQADWSEGRTDIPNPAKAQILVMDYEWLGVGTVRFGFQEPDGEIVWYHHQHHANNVTAVYMATPVNPFRYEIRNSGAGAAATMDCICCEIESEGGEQNPGAQFCDDRGTTALVTLNDADLYPLLALRLEAANVAFVLRSFSTLCTSTALIRWALLLNPTVAGTALSFVAPTNSVVGVAKPTNATKVSGGTILDSGYADMSNTPLDVDKIASDLTKLGMKIDGTSDVLVLAVQRITGTTETFYGSMTWQEVY